MLNSGRQGRAFLNILEMSQAREVPELLHLAVAKLGPKPDWSNCGRS